jgi:hypothetical protein
VTAQEDLVQFAARTFRFHAKVPPRRAVRHG